ncbi:hypothetical protein BDZ45DRAFT_747339 [Acephala macrosclerotiorum]|nr:hypothetical protein BDZ45DRAFT_747339 [Acephala macrosclerotiorum]
MSKKTNQSASVTGNSVILEANLVETDFSSLIKRKHIIVAFKLHFNLSEPIDSSEECEMLNTRAKYCIAFTHIARDLGSTITNVEDFQLSTTTGQNFEFAEIAIIKESEKEMFDEMIFNREKAIVFDWKKIFKIHENISSLVRIKTIQYTA